MDLDTEYMLPLTLNTHFFNISHAHIYPKEAKWEHLHDFLEFYDLKNLSPSELTKMADSIRTNETSAIRYLWNKHKRAQVKKPKECNTMCRLKLYCEIMHPE